MANETPGGPTRGPEKVETCYVEPYYYDRWQPCNPACLCNRPWFGVPPPCPIHGYYPRQAGTTSNVFEFDMDEPRSVRTTPGQTRTQRLIERASRRK